ncbi:hypothetical protein SteCoe_19601 [Stentor coeruleus]|uniref:Uncharacterized protein n=1 Tax=Stentor coeruleus TaxID=5963 RepID=A0A1R2BTW5_9CILI|nr:hypothetical protein SteCoe_19601 [Stentor coeruleus]
MQSLLNNRYKKNNLLLPKLELTTPKRISIKTGTRKVKTLKELAHTKSSKNFIEQQILLTKRTKQNLQRPTIPLKIFDFEQSPLQSPKFFSEKRSIRIRRVSILDFSPVE